MFSIDGDEEPYDPYHSVGLRKPCPGIKSFDYNKTRCSRMWGSGNVFEHYGKRLIPAIIKNCSLLKSININEFLKSTEYKELILYIKKIYFEDSYSKEIISERPELKDVAGARWDHSYNIYKARFCFGDGTSLNLENISTEYLKYIKAPKEEISSEIKRSYLFQQSLTTCRQEIEFLLRRTIYTFSIESKLLFDQISLSKQFEQGEIIYWKDLGVSINYKLRDFMFLKQMQIKQLPKAKFFIYKLKIGVEKFLIYGTYIDLISFKVKALLRKEWRGLSQKTLEEVSGLKNSLFVSSDGLSGGAVDLKTAIQMCKLSL
ncbi:UPF0160 protein MYG1, mitochondrial [Cucumispora dikerogammari]|nr:UPF0160 protein MYG1, mitochondrial [Cucumispora dikerogammari]